jgi:hypothetical protein
MKCVEPLGSNSVAGRPRPLLASGGIVSPTDLFDSVQFSQAEIRAAVEGWKAGTPHALAHCHVAGHECHRSRGSIDRARPLLEPRRLWRMAENGVFMVPTLQTLEMLATYPERWSLQPRRCTAQVRARPCASESVAADAAGVAIASGSDVVGPWQGLRGEGDRARRHPWHAQGQPQRHAHERPVVQPDARIGTVEVGKEADWILVRGEPLTAWSCWRIPDSILFVMKAASR